MPGVESRWHHGAQPEPQSASRRPGANNGPERRWNEASELAADWIWEWSKVKGEPPLLVTSIFQNALGIEVLEEIARPTGNTAG